MKIQLQVYQLAGSSVSTQQDYYVVQPHQSLGAYGVHLIMQWNEFHSQDCIFGKKQPNSDLFTLD